MAKRKQHEGNERASGAPVALRQEDVDLLVAGEMPEVVVARILEARRPAKSAAPRRRPKDKLRPIELTAQDIDLAARGETSAAFTERLDAVGKLDTNRKRAAGSKAAKPSVRPPGEKRTSKKAVK